MRTLIYAIAILFICVAIAGAEIASPNLSGDTVYLFREGVFGVGAGMDIAKFLDGTIAVRAESVFTTGTAKTSAGSQYYGGGVSLNIPKLIAKAGGNWTATAINPSLGILGLYDFNGKKWDVGALLTILKVSF